MIPVAVVFNKEISMKRVMLIALAAVLLVASLAFTQPPAGQKIGLATSLQRGYAGFKTNFTQAAEKMPEADYPSSRARRPRRAPTRK